MKLQYVTFTNWVGTAAIVLAACAISRSAPAGDALLSNLPKLPAPASGNVDFAKDIQPLLAKSCYRCHGSEKQEAGLRLDQKQAALEGGDSGPIIVVGRSANSKIVQLVAGLDADAGPMPPQGEGDALTSHQIGMLRKWIDDGAEWPDELGGKEARSARSDHWSFQPIKRPAIPAVKDRGWPRNALDHFILAKLEAEAVTPSPPADRITLIRRVYLDLIGLPPTPAEVDAFLADMRPYAYEQLVDRLLESPHYGERWGRHWLDLARYADSDGYEKDLPRPFAWRYRDWVIDAFNRDLPFDVFTIQQLAGDLLDHSDPAYDEAAHIATGFHRNAMVNREAGIDPEEDRVKRTIDRTNTTGTVWLGLTVGCANCHTHKYDPISQREYFGLYAFFNNSHEVDVSIHTGELLKPKDQYKPETASKFVQEMRQEPRPRKTHVHLRGDFLSQGPAVGPGTLAVLPPLKPRGKHPDRLDLARWLVDSANPLTARVLVNRLWQWHFGRAPVVSGDDFGKEGERPSHPELLDWLASELRDGGWRMKRIHRLIVTSTTYQQSSAARPELTQRDPYNAWFARQNRFRVEAEIVRDLALSASGLLGAQIGGPSIRPPQPESMGDLTYATEKDENKWVVSAGEDRYRRGMYIWFQRTRPYHSLNSFDAPDATLACTRRERSDTPLQALTLLNDAVFVEAALALGRKMSAEFPNENGATENIGKRRIEFAFRSCLARLPTDQEIKRLGDLYDKALQNYRKNPTAVSALLSSVKDEDRRDSAADIAACLHVARAIMNLDEFFTRE